MVDGDSKPFSIERCRELLGTEDSGLSDEEIEAIRVQTDAWARTPRHLSRSTKASTEPPFFIGRLLTP
jgi:hypothetical protein